MSHQTIRAIIVTNVITLIVWTVIPNIIVVEIVITPFFVTFKKDDWVESRIAHLLPTAYYHIVFTVPHSWNKVMMQSPKELYTILSDRASETLLGFGNNEE
jgi:hypothetical protein